MTADDILAELRRLFPDEPGARRRPSLSGIDMSTAAEALGITRQTLGRKLSGELPWLERDRKLLLAAAADWEGRGLRLRKKLR